MEHRNLTTHPSLPNPLRPPVHYPELRVAPSQSPDKHVMDRPSSLLKSPGYSMVYARRSILANPGVTIVKISVQQVLTIKCVKKAMALAQTATIIARHRT